MTYRNLPSRRTILTCMLTWYAALAAAIWSSVAGEFNPAALALPVIVTAGLALLVVLAVRSVRAERRRAGETAQVDGALGQIPSR